MIKAIWEILQVSDRRGTMWRGNDRSRERLRSESDCSVYDEEYRIIVLGAESVGKTAICQVFVGGKEDDDSYDRLVIQKTAKFRRAEFCTWDAVDGQTCCMRLTEIRMPLSGGVHNGSDDPVFRALTQKADGFLLIYSVTDVESFWAAMEYYHLVLQLRNHADTPLVFIANKTDCVNGQVVTSSKGREAAFDICASYYETSVRSDPDGIKFVFHDVIRQVRSVRMHARAQEQPCTKMRGLIHRLSWKSKKKQSKSRLRHKLNSPEEIQKQL